MTCITIRLEPRHDKPKDYCKADHNNVYSLRSRGLEVVGTRKHGRARRRHACLPRARPFSLSPTTSKRLLHRLQRVLLFRNICKPEEGWYGQLKYCYEKTIYVVLNSFAVVFGLFWFLIFWLIRSLFQRSNVYNQHDLRPRFLRLI